MTKHVHLLINSKSRQGRQAKPLVIEALRRNNIPTATIHDLQDKQNLGAICRTIQKAKPDLLIIAGGDGTVSHSMHYLAASGIKVGIIPLGTTNNFARSLNIPLDIEQAVQHIRHRSARPIDMGIVNKQRFVNVASIGLSAQVAQHVTSALKKRWGRLAYAIAGVKQLFKHQPFIARLHDKDGEMILHFETHQLIIANGRYHAGRKIAEDAAVTSRELVIFALGGRSRLSFIWHMIDFYIGKRKKITHSSYVIGRNVTLTTNRQQQIEIDGEVTDTTPITASVQPATIKVHY